MNRKLQGKRTADRGGRSILLLIIAMFALVAASCSESAVSSTDGQEEASAEIDETADVDETAEDDEASEDEESAEVDEMSDEEETSETDGASAESDDAAVSTRESGMRVVVQNLSGLTVHTMIAPEEVFANATHIFELENSLVLVDTQFLLPNALDMRAYADSLGKPIDRVFVTHEHPDHFLGGEVFNDVPVFALQEVSSAIAEVGDAEVAEKQADFGDAIASTFVTPDIVEPGPVEIDGVTFELDRVVDAEAEVQLVVRVPEMGAVAVGDIVYSDVHLVLAGQPDTWTAALEELAATSDEYPVVLAGHGVPSDPSVYETNIEWLATASQLMQTVDNGEDFKQGMIDAYPDYGMTAAIDLVLGFLFPDS